MAVNVEALKSEVRSCVITQKANACPMVIRLAWHAAGTYDLKSNAHGSNGATMRFEPESTDPANAGLHIIRDMLLPVSTNHPELSRADLWAAAGFAALEFLGGPKIEPTFGRSDAADGTYCPPNGQLPDASQGAAHLREVFGRMGFNDQELVALSGAHTLGRCHLVRSGFDGPWTRNPLKFDNAFFKNLMYMDWKPREWDGPFQFEDVLTGELMMLPTDMALKTDPEFRVHAERYAKDEAAFFNDFAAAFSKLLNNGVPPQKRAERSSVHQANIDFLEAAMHGSVSVVKKLAKVCDVHYAEQSSGRTALHKAAFWGHDQTVSFLVTEAKMDVNARDFNGDTALHDAVRFGHFRVVEILLGGHSDLTIKNRDGDDPLRVAQKYHQSEQLIALLKTAASKL
jgi:catalase (peroxidase I)